MATDFHNPVIVQLVGYLRVNDPTTTQAIRRLFVTAWTVRSCG